MAHAVIIDHGLNKDTILEIADRYAPRRGVDFNAAPARGLANAQLWRSLNAAAGTGLVPAAESARFALALYAQDYAVSDALMSSWLKADRIVDRDGRSLYDEWRHRAECTEGFNAALCRAVDDAVLLYRFVGSADELGNYQSGRWRRAGDLQDRVSLTVGRSNPFLAANADAPAACDARLLAGCIQPVRCSPYQRRKGRKMERFGSEKYAAYAGEG